MSWRYFIRLASDAATRAPPGDPSLTRYGLAGATLWSNTSPLSLGDHGAIIGHMFPRAAGAERVTQLTECQISAILASGGRSLLRDYWGGYVAVLTHPDGSIRVLRDPSSTLPCYYAITDAGMCLASDPIDLVSMALLRPQVDYFELARFLTSFAWCGRATAIAGVSDLIGGECLVVHGLWHHVEIWWSPWSFVSPADGLTAGSAAEQLRAVLLDCIARWAACLPECVMNLSGGLDSSIVAAIAHRHSKLRCLTMIGPDPDGDETRYARVVTDALGLDLLKHQYALDHIAVDRPILPHLPWPAAGYYAQEIIRAQLALATQTPVDAFLVGNGGDAIFCLTRSANPFVDRYLANGMGRGLLATLRDIADLTDASYGDIVLQGIRRLHHRERWGRPRCDFNGLTSTMHAALGPETSHHPWMQVPSNALPGKIVHVGNILRSVRTTEFHRRGEHPPQIAPLLSQPVIELCLQIPMWMWVNGGADRAIARRAMRGIVPDTILDRRSKGGPDGFMQQIARTRRRELHALLRDGLLVTQGVLDPTFLDQPDDPTWRGHARAHQLLSFAVAETWARHWSAGART